WVTIAVGALALAPHAAWLIANDFAPFSYAIVLHGTGSLASTIGDAFGYLAGSVAYVAVPLVIVAVVARPSRPAVKDMAWPSSPARPPAGTAVWAGLPRSPPCPPRPPPPPGGPPAACGGVGF